MGIDHALCLTQTDSVDQAGVIEAVAEYYVFGAEKRGEDACVGVVTTVEQQGFLDLQPVCERVLEIGV